jgi:hypothetical protein
VAKDLEDLGALVRTGSIVLRFAFPLHIMAAEPTATHVVHHDDIAQAEKLGIAVDEVVAARITEEDLTRVSEECLTLRSATGWRIFLIMVVMGANQAGYGVDWGVIGKQAEAPSRSRVASPFISPPGTGPHC